ncbi:MAG TPA: M13 family metallopeptidase [Rhizomicrobium sp.]|jgi:putative endopeptidase|nr:M13 family metallopeptidase [Rhizomicrobium sp.]
MSDFRSPVLVLAAVIVVLAAAAPATPFATPSNPDTGTDTTIRPGDDFYRFANGPWLKATTIPAGRSSYDTSAMLRDENARRVRELVQGAADAVPAGGNPVERALAQKIGDYYASQMDAAAIQAKGLAPLSDELAAIAAITDRDTLSAYLGSTLRLDDGSDTQDDNVFGVWIHQGFHDPDRYVPHLVQGGLGLADREDYFASAPEKAELRSTYRAHIAAVFKLAGFADPDARAARVLDLETALARSHASRADTDDVFKTDNAWRRADFDAKAPGMNWDAYFKAAGLDRQLDFVVWQPSAVTGTAASVAGQPIQAWQDYLVFHLIAHYAAVLPQGFGADAPDRAGQAIADTTAVLGEAIGRLYVARYFPPEAKAAAVVMAENIRAAWRARLVHLAWMSPGTRAKALAKLAALKIGVGYGDTWTDYSALAVIRGDAFGNMRRAEAFLYRHDLAKLAQPVDPAEWSLLPQVVGAVINFSPNSLQFSAGLLQPPYFDFAGDAASNYGSAAAGMAHEIGHSFDELGNIYDAGGRLGQWWTAQDLARYRAAAAPLSAQYDAYCPQAGFCVRGKQVLSESIGDLVGLQVAHAAYLLALNGRPDAVKNGMTGERRFFLAFARRWRRVQSDAALRQQIAGDSHPPGEYRSDTVRNVDAWYRAYDVKPGDKLYLAPKNRIRI